MKKTFYCAMRETYLDGTVKTAVLARESKTRPENRINRNPVVTGRMNWFNTLEQAEAFLAETEAAA